MVDTAKTDPSIIPPDGTPLKVSTALQVAGWEQVDAQHWKRGGGTPIPWGEALIVIAAIPVGAVVPDSGRPGWKTSEFKTTLGLILTFVGSAAMVMLGMVDQIPEAQRPVVTLVLAGLAAATGNRYTTVRTVAKAKE